MRKLYFLLPGTSGKFICGGLFAELKTLALAQRVCHAEVVTYQQREAGTAFLRDLLRAEDDWGSIFVTSWGFHVPRLVSRLRRQFVLYHAHSAGYGFRLPASVPILAVSRNTMGYWGQHCPSSPIYYLPNQISPEFFNQNIPRDIDVLVQVRKSSSYLLNQLVPALQHHCKVVVIDHFVDDLAGLFNQAKVYLYDSAEYWAQYQVSEGFGLPPLEAMACGCQVFSSLNGALADYLDPVFNCQAVGVYSTTHDVERILAALKEPPSISLSPDFWSPYREESQLIRLRRILESVNQFFDHVASYPSDIPDLSPWRMARLRANRILTKVSSKVLSVQNRR